jgi:microcystin-dependent protein
MNTKLTVKIILIIVIIMIVNNINSVDNFTNINEFCSPEEIQKKYQSSDNSGIIRCYIDGIINNYKNNIIKLNEFMNNVSSNDGLKLINELKIKQLNNNGKYFINNDNIVNKNTIIPYLPINNNINSNNIEELWDNNDIPYGWFPCNGKIFNLTNKNNIEKFGQSIVTPDLSNRFIKCNTGNDIGGEKNVKLTSIPNHSHSLNIGQHNYNQSKRLIEKKSEFITNNNINNTNITVDYTHNNVKGHNNMPPYYTVIFIGKLN